MTSKIIAAGALGGISPTLIRLAIDFVNGNSSIGQLNASIILGIGLFAFLGACVAAVWGETDLKKVFYVGLGLPSLVTVIASHGSAPAPSAASLFFPSAVFAADDAVAGRSLKVQLPADLAGTQPRVVFSTEAGDQTVAMSNGGVVAVPPSATSVRIQSSVGSSNQVPLPRTAGGQMTLQTTAEKSAWYGFKYAVGLHSQPFSLNAHVVP
ncbi:MAG: hypothetical protein ACLPWF_21180 [Bryobacteraceae bacterium]